MRKIVSRVLASVVLFGCVSAGARSASAQCDYTVPIGLTLSANFNTIQIHFDYQCDDNQDAATTVRYWKTADGPGFADVAYPLIPDFQRRDFNGTIFWLEEGTSYTVEVFIDDQHDGIRGDQLWTTTITTRSKHQLPANPPRVWVATNGNDATGNGTSAQPYKTIAKAHSVLAAGGEIRLKLGTYSESATLTLNGTAGNYYSLVGDGPPGSVVLDGSQMFTNGWGKYKRGSAQIDNIWVRAFTASTDLSDLNVVFQGLSERLHKCISRSELENNQAGWPAGRFWYDTTGVDSLFVRLADGASPNNNGTLHNVRVAKWSNAIKVWGSRWHLKNLDARYYNHAAYLLGAYGYNFAAESVVDSCKASCYGGGGVFGNKGTDGVLVDGCTFSDPRLDTWPYDASKARAEEDARGLIWVGRAWVVRHCLVTGTFDGIQTIGSYCDPLPSQDSDVDDNVVDGVCDDGLEFDATNGINLSAWRNTIRRANHGFSSNPLYQGPLYVLYNTFVDYDQAGIKSGAACPPPPPDPCYPCSSPGWVGFFHNTFASQSPGSAMHSVGGYFGNQHYLNNILTGTHGTTGSYGPFVVYADNQGDPQTCSFDYDLVYLQNNLSGQPIWRWGFLPPMQNYYYFSVGPTGDLYNGNAQAPSRGWEPHGFYGAPAFADTAAGDYHLVAGSPAINLGVLISGINTPVNTRNGVPLYSGSAPDAGAFEYTGFAPQARSIPVGAPISLRIGSPSPNPSRGRVEFVLENSAPLVVEAKVFDIGGRMVKSLTGGTLAAGRHVLQWDGTGQDGERAATGMYFLRVTSSLGRRDSRIVLMR